MFGININIYFQDGRVKDLSQLFQAKTIKIVEDTTKKLRIVEHLQVIINPLTRQHSPFDLGRSWPRRRSTCVCGLTVIERERTSASR